MRKVLSLMLVLFSLSVLGQDEMFDNDDMQYLVVGNEYYSEVTGDALEAGLLIQIELDDDNGNKLPEISIPEGDNFADCRVFEIKLEQRRVLIPNYTLGTYKIWIATGVGGDTGGCLVMVKDANAETMKIVNYRYITDY